MSKRLSKKKAILAIEKAFQGVTLDNGVSLHETVEIDDLNFNPMTSTARQLDETHNWSKLIASENIFKFCWIGGVSFLDAEGFIFHIPAYLITDIRTNMLGDISSNVIHNLTNPHDERLEGFKLFNSEQRKAVYNAVKYLGDFDLIDFDEDIKAGLEKYWS